MLISIVGRAQICIKKWLQSFCNAVHKRPNNQGFLRDLSSAAYRECIHGVERAQEQSKIKQSFHKNIQTLRFFLYGKWHLNVNLCFKLTERRSCTFSPATHYLNTIACVNLSAKTSRHHDII